MTKMDLEESLAAELIEQLVAASLRGDSSDIHLEPGRDEVVVRFRFPDGLHEVGRHSLEMGRLTRRTLKKMCRADVETEDVPQDGRLLFETSERQRVFARMSTFPTVFGERLVLRLEPRGPEQWSEGVEGLELAPAQKQALDELISCPEGLLLFTSALGSSDLIYPVLSSLAERCEGRKNIVSLECPVTSFLPGVAQTQIEQHGQAYALRAVSRQDPDVVACAWAGDLDTVRELLQLALSGKLVIAQMRAADIADALYQWSRLGLEPNEIETLRLVLKGVVAGRTVRRICSRCQGQQGGCAVCHHTGLHGRVSVLQTVSLDESMTGAVLKASSLQDIRDELGGDWRDRAREVAEAGLTTPREALRAT